MVHALPGPASGKISDAEKRARRSAERSHRTLRLSSLAGWVGLLLIVSVVALASYQYRAEIVRIWPKAATLYEAIGQPVNIRGLAFKQANFTYESRDGTPVLHIKGLIVNETNQGLSLPMIHISLRDEAHRSLYNWTIDPPVEMLEGLSGEGFTTQLVDPPIGAQDLVIGFMRPLE